VTGEKLEQLAEDAAQTASQPVTASQVVAATIEQFVVALPQWGERKE
jgi:hypothetical protein